MILTKTGYLIILVALILSLTKITIASIESNSQVVACKKP